MENLNDNQRPHVVIHILVLYSMLFVRLRDFCFAWVRPPLACRRRPRRPPAEIAESRAGGRSHPHGARDGLFLRREVRAVGASGGGPSSGLRPPSPILRTREGNIISQFSLLTSQRDGRRCPTGRMRALSALQTKKPSREGLFPHQPKLIFRFRRSCMGW